MSDASDGAAADRRFRSGAIGLAWLAAINLAVVATCKLIPAVWGYFFQPQRTFEYYIGNSLTMGVLVACAIAASFIPRHRFFGLACACGMSVAIAAIDWINRLVIAPQHANESALFGLSGWLFISLGMLAIGQGLRLFLSWKLQGCAQSLNSSSLQFQVSDVIEWTVTIAIWLVIVQATSTPWRYVVAQLAVGVGPIALVAIPAAIVTTSANPPRLFSVLAVVLWAFVVRLTVNVAYRLIDPSAFSNRPWWYFGLLELTEYGALLVVTGLNFAAIRWLGFRFTSRRLFRLTASVT